MKKPTDTSQPKGLTCEPAVRSKERTRTPCKGVKPAQSPQNLRDFVQKVLPMGVLVQQTAAPSTIGTAMTTPPPFGGWGAHACICIDMGRQCVQYFKPVCV